MIGIMVNIIVAYDKNRGIGANNDLLWQRDLPSDLRRFKDLTIGKTVIMGRKTFESIGRPLPGRRNIVLSKSMTPTSGIELAGSLKEAFILSGDDNIFVIGGESVFQEALFSANTIYATEVKAVFPQATVFFPVIDMSQWQEVSREHHVADGNNKYDFDFVEYRRI